MEALRSLGAHFALTLRGAWWVLVGLATLTLLRVAFYSREVTDCAPDAELEKVKAKVLVLQGQLHAAALREFAAAKKQHRAASIEETASALEIVASPLPTPPDDSAAWPHVSAQLAAARRAAGRHPRYRLALVVPWLGDSFPSWFPYFVESCRASDYIADVLIFHENAKVRKRPRLTTTDHHSIAIAATSTLTPVTATTTRKHQQHHHQVPAAPPPNVRFINLGQHGLGILFGAALARLGGSLEHT